jgi:hypothetical protein
MSDYLVKYMVKKVSWRGNYDRILAVSKIGFETLDPKDFTATNSYEHQYITNIELNLQDPCEFTINSGGPKPEVLKMRCDYRTQLVSRICALHTAPCSCGRVLAAARIRTSCCHAATPPADLALTAAPRRPCFAAQQVSDLVRMKATSYSTPGQSKQYQGSKYTRSSRRVECVLEVAPSSLNYLGVDGTIVSSYQYKDIESIRLIAEEPAGFVVNHVGRGRLFFVAQRGELLSQITASALKLGIALKPKMEAVGGQAFISERSLYGSAARGAVQFDVAKPSARHPESIARKIMITQQAVVERDSDTFGVVSMRPLTSIFALVRNWNDPQRIVIE